MYLRQIMIAFFGRYLMSPFYNGEIFSSTAFIGEIRRKQRFQHFLQVRKTENFGVQATK